MVFEVPITDGYDTTHTLVPAPNGIDAQRACWDGPRVRLGTPKFMGWWTVEICRDGTHIPWFRVSNGILSFNVESHDPSYDYLTRTQARGFQATVDEIEQENPTPPDYF